VVGGLAAGAAIAATSPYYYNGYYNNGCYQPQPVYGPAGNVVSQQWVYVCQ
jgi:hypothetical protein